jgi:hypothetical protein
MYQYHKTIIIDTASLNDIGYPITDYTEQWIAHHKESRLQPSPTMAWHRLAHKFRCVIREELCSDANLSWFPTSTSEPMLFPSSSNCENI